MVWNISFLTSVWLKPHHMSTQTYTFYISMWGEKGDNVPLLFHTCRGLAPPRWCKSWWLMQSIGPRLYSLQGGCLSTTQLDGSVKVDYCFLLLSPSQLAFLWIATVEETEMAVGQQEKVAFLSGYLGAPSSHLRNIVQHIVHQLASTVIICSTDWLIFLLCLTIHWFCFLLPSFVFCSLLLHRLIVSFWYFHLGKSFLLFCFCGLLVSIFYVYFYSSQN